MAIRERKARAGTIPDGGMADIAFLLLIFFLVTTTIDMDKGIGIILPAEGQELEINKKNILNCLIIGDNDHGSSLYNEIIKHPELGYRSNGIFTFNSNKKSN